MRADGDIPLGMPSKNQCDLLIKGEKSSMFYVALWEPYGDLEAYVVVDGSGRLTYYDFSHKTLVIEDIECFELNEEEGDRIRDLCDIYELEHKKDLIKESAIKAYMSLLKTIKEEK